jgi:hypothetical protein
VRCRTIAETATVAGFWLVLKCRDLLVLWREGPYETMEPLASRPFFQWLARSTIESGSVETEMAPLRVLTARRRPGSTAGFGRFRGTEGSVDQWDGSESVPQDKELYGTGVLMANLKTIATGATIASALAFTALGVGAGVANADPASPHPAVMTSKLDGFALDDWGGRGWGGGGGPGYGWGGGPGYGYGGGPGYGYGGGPGYGYGGGPGYGYGGACAFIPPVVAVWIPPAACGG